MAPFLRRATLAVASALGSPYRPRPFTGLFLASSPPSASGHLGLVRSRPGLLLDLNSLFTPEAFLLDATHALAAAALRAYLRVIYASNMLAGPSQQKLCFSWRNDAVAGDEGDGKKARNKAAAGQGQGQGQTQRHTSLATEWAVALVALAAELARAAAAEDRRGADGIRRACGALCDAAGALRAAAGPCTTDACLAAFERLVLAQALECYFELAVAGGKPPALCSKIAQQVGTHANGNRF